MVTEEREEDEMEFERNNKVMEGAEDKGGIREDADKRKMVEVGWGRDEDIER